jgi:hypothetical protein
MRCHFYQKSKVEMQAYLHLSFRLSGLFLRLVALFFKKLDRKLITDASNRKKKCRV